MSLVNDLTYFGTFGGLGGNPLQVAREGNDGGRPRHPGDALTRFGLGVVAYPNPDDPNPPPWPFAVSLLVTTIGLKQAALGATAGEANREVIRWADATIADFLDDWCPTRPHPLGVHGPRPPGPNPWTPALVAQLGLVADSLHSGGIREELHQVAGLIVTRTYAMNPRAKAPLPTPEELEALTHFSSPNAECTTLCNQLIDLSDQLQGAVGPARTGIALAMKMINRRMTELNCKICKPE